MIRVVTQYMQERSPWWLLIPMVAILFSAGLQHTDIPIFRYVTGFFSMYIFLFLIRLSDDICDIYIDKITHPERLLCASSVARHRLNQLRLVLVISLLLIQTAYPQTLLFMLVTVAVYSLFFIVKPKLPLLLNIAVLNASLAVFPIYAGLLFDHGISAFQGLMGLFFFLGGFAHDLSHGLIDNTDQSMEKLNPINRVRQRPLAILSAGLFLLCATVGLYLFYTFNLGLWFLLPLLIMVCVIFVFEIRLIKKPTAQTAKPFYILGFVFFMLPALGHILNIMLF